MLLDELYLLADFSISGTSLVGKSWNAGGWGRGTGNPVYIHKYLHKRYFSCLDRIHDSIRPRGLACLPMARSV